MNRGAVSYWASTASEDYAPEPSRLPARVKTLIVGAGLSGAAAAYDLRQSGCDPEDVLVIDAVGPAFGASGRNGGFLLSFPGVELLDWIRHRGEDRAAELVRLNIENRELAARFIEDQGLWSQRGGSWSLAVDEAESRLLERCHAFLEQVAPGAFQFATRAPAPVAGFAAGVSQPADQGIHPADYTAALLKASGARVVLDCAVEGDGIRVGDGGVTVTTSKGEVSAERVVLCANAWLPEFFPSMPAGLLRPVRNHVLVAHLEEESPEWGDAVWYADHGYLYFRTLPGGRFLLGGARNVDPDSEETIDAGSNPRIAEHLRAVVLPKLLGGTAHTIEAEWTGPMAFTPDGLPVAGAAPGCEGRVHVLAGFTGYGLGFHRVAARELVGRMAGEGSGHLAFDPARFNNAGDAGS